MSNHHFLAFDLGASSGRAMLGTLLNGNLELTEIHRFNNQMLKVHGSYYWNIFSLFEELKTGLKKCVNEFHIQPESIGIDTWGVDYVLLASDGQCAGLPYAYRDHRTDKTMEQFFELLPAEETYMLTGIQFMQFNSLFQLFASVKDHLFALSVVDSLLFMPDALSYLFTGIKKNEYTIASTSQLLKPGKPQWESKLFEVGGINQQMMQDIIQPGSVLGTITEDNSQETGSKIIPCVAVASHDTASAIVSVPALEKNWAYISSGTWSLMGIESKVPIVNEKSLEMNFTNEGGVEGTTRFLKNIMGMWLIQECKRSWDEEKEIDWPEIVQLAQKEEPFSFLINPDDSSFLNPGNMPRAIAEYCIKKGQKAPESKGEIARCIYDSLALKYKYTLEQIEEITQNKIEKLYVIGGGANNKFLCQLTADATGLEVLAGPTEATAIGNIMMQAKALGYVNSLTEIRQVIKKSFKSEIFNPSKKYNWDAAYIRFEQII